MVKAETTQLKNGFKVANVAFPGIESVSFILTGRAGSNYEKPDEIGAAHFLEHLLFDGSKKYQTAKDLQKVVLDVGGNLDGSTGRERVVYKVKVLKKDVEKAFDYLSQLIIYPLFKEEDIAKEKNIIREEINRRASRPEYEFSKEVMNKLFFPSQRLSYYNTGAVIDIEKLTRDSIIGFYDQYYNGENFVLSICGDVDSTQVFSLASKYFDGLNGGQTNTSEKWSKNEELGIYAKQTPEAKQAKLYIDWWGFDRFDSKKYPTSFLRAILGQSTISRLFLRIRQELGLAYEVSANLSCNATWGTFGIKVGISEQNLNLVVKVIKEEIHKISQKLVTEEEFNRIKNDVLADFAFAEENPYTRAGFYAAHLLGDEPCESPQQVLETYQAVTPEDVKNIAIDIFSRPPKLSALSKNLTDKQLLEAWNNGRN